MEREKKLKFYKKQIIILIVIAVMYLFFAIGDVFLKGYSNLPSSGFIILVVTISVLIRLYLNERNK